MQEKENAVDYWLVKKTLTGSVKVNICLDIKENFHKLKQIMMIDSNMKKSVS